MKHQGEPRTITLDGFEPSHSALGCMGMRNEFNYRWENSVKIRSCQYLNNIVEQDHRRVKFRLQPMLGFQRFYHARRVIAGVELAATTLLLQGEKNEHDPLGDRNTSRGISSPRTGTARGSGG
jgi:transposase-like protein